MSWNPAIESAAEAMYSRLRIADPERYPEWGGLDIDSYDHYCIAAEKGIKAFYRHGLVDLPEEWEVDRG